VSELSHALLGLIAQTPIHAGASASEGIVDLPIQREAHTDWPCIYGSSMKGAIRAKAEPLECFKGNKDIFFEIFGPDTGNAADHASSMSVTDARLLFMPVRSLTTHFRYVTCPALLKRFKKDLARLGFSELTEFSVPTVTADRAICGDSQGELYLEEFLFQSDKGEVDDLINALSVIFSDEVADEVKSTLTIISDDQFRHIVRAATPVQARIAIENENKVVKGGALWYEESLPPETIMYTTLSAVSGRGKAKQSAEVIRNSILDQVFDQPYLQVGGNETVGMGWFQVTPYIGKEGA